jgi:hypothetical protein
LENGKERTVEKVIMGLETDRNWVLRKGGRGSEKRQHVGGSIDSQAH